jgi:glycosyltransferase involved in cell wall biosynthesis
LDQASAVITLNPADADCLPDPGKLRFLTPFLDPKPYGKAHGERAQHRQGLARRLDLDPSRPWLLTVAMMRAGDKFQSYRILSEALCRMRDQDWTLVIVGDGPAAPEVRNLFSAIPAARLRFLGALPPEDLFEVYAACDLLAWPAVREAYGMALLEAQATGLPVLAGESPGVAAVLGDGESAVLVEEGSTEAFSTALANLLANPGRLPQLSKGALHRVRQHHSLKSAARRLDNIVREAAAR